jgi:hypothetical protein
MIGLLQVVDAAAFLFPNRHQVPVWFPGGLIGFRLPVWVNRETSPDQRDARCRQIGEPIFGLRFLRTLAETTGRLLKTKNQSLNENYPANASCSKIAGSKFNLVASCCL